MRTKAFTKRAIATGLMASLLAGCTTVDEPTSDVTLRVTSGVSSLNIAWTDGVVTWMDEVTALSNGEIEFETFTGGELVELTAETHALDTGVTDVAMMLPTYQPDQYPLIEVAMLPLVESDTLVGSRAWKELLESDAAVYDGQTYHEWQFGSKGLKALPLHTVPEYSVATTGGGFDSIAALQSLQLRTASRVQNITSELVGANAVSIPNAEAYDALSRGTIDGGFAAIADWANYGLQDLYQTTLTGVNFGHFPLVMAMTDETWESLSPEHREIMQQAMENTYEASAQAWIDRMDEIRTYNVEEAGGELVSVESLPEDVRELIVESVNDTWTEWIAMMEGAGMPGRTVAEEWVRAVENSGGEVPSQALTGTAGN